MKVPAEHDLLGYACARVEALHAAGGVPSSLRVTCN